MTLPYCIEAVVEHQTRTAHDGERDAYDPLSGDDPRDRDERERELDPRDYGPELPSSDEMRFANARPEPRGASLDDPVAL